MNVGSADQLSTDNADAVTEALIARCRMSPEHVEVIRETARTSQVSFGEAAVRAGLVSATDLEEVAASVRGSAQPLDSGLIETALSRLSASRSIVIRPTAEVKPGASLILAQAADNPRSEQIKALRTALLMLNEAGRQASLVALLSPCAGEGRSQLAAELAIAFSQLGRRTLLVDADLRKPRQQELFGAWNYAGLAQALELARTPQYLAVEGLPHLSVLTAGLVTPNPLELLSNGRFERLLSDWRHQYEFVVIDTPPVSEYSDALAIATLTGRVLICSRKGSTPYSAMKAMLRRLENTQSRILGAVVSNF